MARTVTRSRVETSNLSISNFTRVSKANVPFDAAGKKAAALTVDSPVSRKRKVVEEESVSFPPSSNDDAERAKRNCRREEPLIIAKPAPVKGKRVVKPVPARSHTANRDSLVSKTTKKTIQTKLDGIVKRTVKKDTGLPAHLAELIDLNKAFLKTTLIHIAHNGSNVPIDFKAISPNISRTWGKRQITIEDIRRCIAVQTTSPFIVSDYGRGKVCIELHPDQDAATINEAKLCKQFEENLRSLCREKATDQMADVNISLDSLSIADLPQVDITNKNSGIKAHPALAKGERTLSAFKNDLAARQEAKTAQQENMSSNQMLNPDGTKMGLLDRLRLKQLAKTNAAIPPSGPELQRRAALNRVTGVSAMIATLCMSNPYSLPRQSFTMADIQSKLKDSLRTPISKEEAATTVRLIASEVAPQWLRIVTIGGRENIVVQRDWQPQGKEIQERVQKLLA